MKPYQAYRGCDCEECSRRNEVTLLEQDMRNLKKRKEEEKEVRNGFIISSATLAMMFAAGVAWAICAASKAGSFISVFSGFVLGAPLTILFIIMFVLTIAYWGDYAENGRRRWPNGKRWRRLSRKRGGIPIWKNIPSTMRS